MVIIKYVVCPVIFHIIEYVVNTLGKKTKDSALQLFLCQCHTVTPSTSTTIQSSPSFFFGSDGAR